MDFIQWASFYLSKHQLIILDADFLGMQGDDRFFYRGAESLGRREGGGVCDFRNGPPKAEETEDAAEQKSLDETFSLRDALCYRKRIIL